MKMGMPAIPLITIDPYFSVWGKKGDLNGANHTMHWTGKNNTILGTVTIDGETYCFIGSKPSQPIKQVSIDADALSTYAVYEGAGIRLFVTFTTPVMADSLYYSSRPVSYIKISYESIDSNEHQISVHLAFSEEFVLNNAGEGRAVSEEVSDDTVTCIKMSNGYQTVLGKRGDDIRIDWGSFYLAAKGEAKVGNICHYNLYCVYIEKEIENETVFAVAYDDIESIKYFDSNLKAYWKKDGKTINEAIVEALDEYDSLFEKCQDFSNKLIKEATAKGGEKYADLLCLAYRQVMAAHKLVVDNDGNNLYISKECHSNGCAATVDVTYPSAPMYLYYNTELLKGMLRPVFKYASMESWPYDFAPHDVGQYPFVTGQYYGMNIENQMPVEECGNILVLMSAISEVDGNCDFARENIELLDKWSKYLIQYGEDPEFQLCTDDFAGRLAHNCNLSIKAIMGIAGLARIYDKLGRKADSEELLGIAEKYAKSFIERASNKDGSFRLAFDKEGTFSLKYNAVWDKLWKTELFPESFYINEIERYKKETLPYGIPLDNREKYTKSDWMIWAACLADKKEDFKFIAELLWKAYNVQRCNAPMTDWFFADTSEMRAFRHRTVQGGLFIKLLFS
ncbi:MAG: DUF4965 domain-containing protein [Acutalibacteraceae bacterium]|nr:DUF4965 domain-containing protein [Acutalibacteraceae bacterium]